MHISVMKEEILELLDVKKGLFYIDCTFGEGGHTKSILEKGGIVLAIDRDSLTKKYADQIQLQFPDTFLLVNDSFSNIYNIWEKYYAPIKVDGVLFDLGFSSNQIEDQERGFSFLYDSNLDMRYDSNENTDTALNFLNTASILELSEVFFKYGEELKAKIVAKLICEYRKKQKITTCFQLLNIIQPAFSNQISNKHFATKIFQALRIYINKEFEHIEKGVSDSLKILRHYGKTVVLTFHSLEDRLVKNILNTKSFQKPASDEVKINKRSRSATLRHFLNK